MNLPGVDLLEFKSMRIEKPRKEIEEIREAMGVHSRQIAEYQAIIEVTRGEITRFKQAIESIRREAMRDGDNINKTTGELICQNDTHRRLCKRASNME
jgi:chromosome segregation ATPase